MQPMVADKMKARREFALRLNAALDRQGFSLPDAGTPLAAKKKWLTSRFKVSGEAARKWLSGEGQPEPARWADLAAALGVQVEWLYSGAGPMLAHQGFKVGEGALPRYDAQPEDDIDRIVALMRSDHEFRALINTVADAPKDKQRALPPLLQDAKRKAG